MRHHRGAEFEFANYRLKLTQRKDDNKRKRRISRVRATKRRGEHPAMVLAEVVLLVNAVQGVQGDTARTSDVFPAFRADLTFINFTKHTQHFVHFDIIFIYEI
jgi:hypothetical protein